MTFENAVARAMRMCHNYFEQCYKVGNFTVSNGSIDGLPKSPFILIVGSSYNDGIHRMIPGIEAVKPLIDETFYGRIWMLKPNEDFVEICRKISADDERVSNGADIVSESFGNYSHSFAQGKSGGRVSALELHAQELMLYYKPFTEVDERAV